MLFTWLRRFFGRMPFGDEIIVRAQYRDVLPLEVPGEQREAGTAGRRSARIGKRPGNVVPQIVFAGQQIRRPFEIDTRKDFPSHGHE